MTCKNIYIFGDSHSMIFCGNDIENYKFIDLHKNATTIIGLNKINSKLKYGNFIINKINSFSRNDYCIIKLGQVDIEIVYWFKLCVKNENISIDQFIKNIINNYKKFIVDNKISEKINIIISGIHLPSYYDDEYIKNRIPEIWGELDDNIKTNYNLYVNKFISYNVTRDILTKNNLLFNKYLKEMCNELNLKYFDTTEYFIDIVTNLLQEKYIGNPKIGPIHNKDAHYKSIFDKSDMTPQIISQTALINFIKT